MMKTKFNPTIMEKLNIEVLAPYLPYGLKLQRLNKDNLWKIIEMNNGNIMYPIENPDRCKPILRPLSDLLQPNHILGIGYRTLGRSGKPAWTLEQYEYLFKNHFDVFGLIEQGLAIDINTLTPN